LLYLIALILVFYTLFRSMSRNIYARRAEDDRFQHLIGRFRKMFRVEKKRMRDRKYYRYFRCSSCGQHVRVPKGRGHVVVTCPKCRHSFEKTT
ncbi:MAG: hypothetical protein KBS83_04020, partial [Lachnospiraceae bacterium]|nr:hypothetical protein [Candidatus Equihabitans merdae]